jgi:uncharacterized protein YkwD
MTTIRITPSRRSATVVLAAVVASIALVLAVAAPARAAEDDDILTGLNASRASAELPALARDAALDAVALAWAEQMSDTDTLSHNPDVGTQIPAGWSGYGENVAEGFSTGSATSAGWAASPPHYANMVGSFTSVGIAYLASGTGTWAVEVFANYPGAAVASVATAATPTTAATNDGLVAPVTAEPATSVSPVVYLIAGAALLVLIAVGLVVLISRRRAAA